MTTFNTGNPIGSAAAKDLYDNAENLDEFVNSQDKTEHPDRLGVPRKTWHGMEQDFQAFLQSSGYQDLGDYAAGIEITARNQVIRADGELWRVSASVDLPYTTDGTGMPEGGAFVSVGDAALRQELADPAQGGDLVQVTTSTGEQTLAGALDDRVVKGEVSDEPVTSTFGEESVGALFQARAVTLSSISSMAGLPTGSLSSGASVYLSSGGRSGLFTWDSGDRSDDVGNDPEVGVFIAPSSDPSGDSGAWVRQYTGPVMAEWFGAEPWVIGGSQDSTQAFQAAANFAGRGGCWRWRGRHRITGTVTIPFRQTFGSFGQMSSVSVELFDPSDFQGMHTSPFSEVSDRVDNAVFFDADTGDAFWLNEAAQPSDFLLYGKGFNTSGIDVTTLPSSSSFYDTSALRHGKFIRPSRVTILGFMRAFDSYPFDDGGNYEGDYYTFIDNCEVSYCRDIIRASTLTTFNTKIVNLRAFAARIGDFAVSTRNLVFIGGSIEGYREQSVIRAQTNLVFYGTYFETFNEDFDGIVFNLTGRCTLAFRDCLVYLNHTSHFVSSGGSGQSAEVGSLLLNSSGNEFRRADGGSGFVYSVAGVPNLRYGVFADLVIQSSASTVNYVTGSIPNDSIYAAPLVLG